MLLSSTAVYQVIVATYVASVVTGFLAGAKPDDWVADRYTGQAGQGTARQVCLTHLLRHAQDAIEQSFTTFAPGRRFLLRRAVAIGKRRERLKDSTVAQYRANLDRRLSWLLSETAPTTNAARQLFQALRRDRDDLFRFVTRRDVPHTNNACDRAQRPAVIFRKVTCGSRAERGATVYAPRQPSSLRSTARPVRPGRHSRRYRRRGGHPHRVFPAGWGASSDLHFPYVYAIT